MAVDQAMLMAAGLGTRLRPITDRIPKALVPVMGIPAAQFAIDQLALAGVKKVVVNVHHLAEQAKLGFKALDWHGMVVIFSDESQLLLGSGGGIRKALPHFGGAPFFLLNADVLSSVSLSALAERHEKNRLSFGAQLTLSLRKTPPDHSLYREIRMDADGEHVASLGELAVGKPFFTGAAVIESEAIAGLPQETAFEFVPEILRPLTVKRLTGFYLSYDFWADIGTPELWKKIHFDFMETLETSIVPQLITRRIQSSSVRMGYRQWCSCRTRRGSVEMLGAGYADVTKGRFLLKAGDVLYSSLLG